MRRTSFLNSLPALLLALSGVACMHAQAAPAHVLDARTSWIGNTFGFGDGTWTQINITAIAVAPDGKVYTNAPWDESGAEASVYQNGKMLGFAGGTHGWGNGGGNAIAVNRKYVFVAIAVGNEKGHLVEAGRVAGEGQAMVRHFAAADRRPEARRAVPSRAAKSADPHAQLAAGFLMMNEVPTGASAEIGGLAANDTHAVRGQHRAKTVLRCTTPNRCRRRATWSVHEPGRIALAPDGTLWVLTRHAQRSHAACRALHGKRAIASTIRCTLPADTVAGRYRARRARPRADRRQRSASTGAVFQQEQRSLCGVGLARRARRHLQRRRGQAGAAALQWTDRRRRGCARQRVCLDQRHRSALRRRSARASAPRSKAMRPMASSNWQVQGLLFVDGAWIDPARPDSVYTGNKRFELDLIEAAGSGLEIRGFLSNRFKYPDDPVFHTDQWPGLPIARQTEGPHVPVPDGHVRGSPEDLSLR